MKQQSLLYAASVLLTGALISFAPGQQPFFESSFEANDANGATYNLGDLTSQGAVAGFTGWRVEAADGAAVNVVAPGGGDIPAPDGSRVVAQDPNTSIIADITNASRQVGVRAYHNGAGVAEGELDAPVGPAASVIGYVTTGAGSYNLRAWNGSLGTPGYVAPIGGSPNLSTAQYNEIIVLVNYDTKTYAVGVNGRLYFENLGFFDATIDSFSGFQASTREGARIDDLFFFETDGDYDGDGIPDIEELRNGTDMFTPEVIPTPIPTPVPDLNDPACLIDTDRDGLLDCTEIFLGTDPFDKDTDNDGIEDGVEVALGTDPLDDQSPLIKTDSNNDGVPDAFKLILGLSLTDPDTDGDGYLDFWELATGSDPLDPTSRPKIGDANNDGVSNFVDGIIILNIFLGNLNPANFAAQQHLDVDRSGGAPNFLDGIVQLNWFLGNFKYLPYTPSLE